MKLNALIALTGLNLILILYGLYRQNKAKKEILITMTEQEQRLNEQLERQNSALTTVAGGVNVLQTTVTELKNEIRVLRENNPDLEDEIAKAAELADRAETIAGGMSAALPTPENPEGGDTSGESENGGDVPVGGGDTSGESGETSETGDAAEADTEEFPASPESGENPGDVSGESGGDASGENSPA